MNNSKDAFYNEKYDIEHALNMFAEKFCYMPAVDIYDEEVKSRFSEILKNCHIYIIGYVPKIKLFKAEQFDKKLIITVDLNNEKMNISYPIPIPDGFNLKNENGRYYLENKSGKKITWNKEYLLNCITSSVNPSFLVKYIGQSYGKDGSRSAIDRLLKHETLQKISLKDSPEGDELTVLLLQVQTGNRVLSIFNPHAKLKEKSDSRIKAGLDKLFGTTEAERISLYEASLIRYFMPEYNKEFKNSFPSTNLKVLKDCYKKDFSAVIAEISLNHFPFNLYSETIKPKKDHIAKHDLHNEQNRKIFFQTNNN